MSRDQLIDEIRKAQRAIRSSREDSPAITPSPPTLPMGDSKLDNRATLRHLIGELASRLDRTQEQLLARLGDLQQAPTMPVTAGTPAERQLYQEILSRLDPSDARAAPANLEPRLAAIESRLVEVATLLSSFNSCAPTATPTAVEGALENRLASLEEAIRDSQGSPSASIDLTEVIRRLDALSDGIPRTDEIRDVVGLGAPALSLSPLEERLDSISERLGGDAGAMTLGTAIARLGESLERIESRVESAPPTTRVDGTPAIPPVIEEILGEILAATKSSPEGGNDATKAIGTLKRDFSLLVHTINGHLQESRHRSDQVENTLGELKDALVPIARHVGVVIGGEPAPAP